MPENKQTAKNLIFNTISFAINFFISFFFTPYLIKTVGKEAYSFFPLINNIIGYSSIVTTAVGSMAGRFVTIHFYKKDLLGANQFFNSVWIANFVLSIFFTLLSCILLFFLPVFLTIPENLVHDVQILFLFAAATLIIGLLTSVLGLGTFVKNRVDLQASRTVISNIIRVVSIIILFSLFKPSIVYMSVSAFIAGVILMCFNISFKKRLLPELSFAPVKYYNKDALITVISSGIWNSVNQLSNVLLQQFDLLLTNIFIGASATGDYSIAKLAPTLILNLLSMLSGTFFPKFNILFAQEKFEELVLYVKRVTKFIGYLVGIPIGFLIVFGQIFFQLWVPSENATTLYWLSFITVLPIIFTGSVNPIYGVFSATNKLKIPSLVLLCSGFFNTIFILILLKVTSLGIFSIPIAGAIQMSLRNTFFTTIYGAKCLNQKWNVFFPALFQGIRGLGIVIICGLLFKSFINVNNWETFFVVLFMVGSLSLLINGIILDKECRIFILSIIKKVRKRINSEN